MAGGGFTIGDWCWFTRQASPCRVIERQDVWGEEENLWRMHDEVICSLDSVKPLEGHWAHAVREHRCRRLQQEHNARTAALDDMEASVPDLNAVTMVRVRGSVMPGANMTKERVT